MWDNINIEDTIMQKYKQLMIIENFFGKMSFDENNNFKYYYFKFKEFI